MTMESNKKTRIASPNSTQNLEDDASATFTEFQDDGGIIDNPTSYMLDSDDNLDAFSDQPTGLDCTPNAYLKNQAINTPLPPTLYRTLNNKSNELLRSNTSMTEKSAASYRAGKLKKKSRPTSRPNTPKHSPLLSSSRASSVMLHNYQRVPASKPLSSSSGAPTSILFPESRSNVDSLSDWTSSVPNDVQLEAQVPSVNTPVKDYITVESDVTFKANSIASRLAGDDDRQDLKGGLLRSNSLARGRDDLGLIKCILTRSKSLSKRVPESSNNSLLLFSQYKESISCSQSLMRHMISDFPSIDTGSTLPNIDDLWNTSSSTELPKSAKFINFNKETAVLDKEPRKLKEGDSDDQSQTFRENEAQVANGSIKHADIEEEGEKKKEEVVLVEEERDDEEGNSDVSLNLNSLTQETELNCLKGKKTRLRKKFFQFSPLFRQSYVDENPKLSKASDDNFWSSKVGGTPLKVTKVTNEETQYIIVWVLFVLLMASLCTLIPLVIIYSRGTSTIVKNYLDNSTPEHRSEILKDYKLNIMPIDTGKSVVLSNFTFPQNSTENQDDLYTIIPNLSNSIAGITSLENIPKKYMKNKEINAVMNNKNLRNIFYGIDYAPRNVIYPICGVNLHDVMLDVALLSQVTSRIRTYGLQCDQAKFILDSIDTLKLNVSLAMGVWIGPNDEFNRQQLQAMRSILKSYPRQYFESIYIGNEVLFREDQTVENLVKYIYEAKSFVQKEMKWDLPVGTSELGFKADAELMKAADVFGSNTHPFFNGESVEGASEWVYDFLKYQVEPIKAQIQEPKEMPQLVISEVGWPYQGGKYSNALAGKRQMQYFLNNWICDFDGKYPWYFFEAFDEPWKEIYHREGARWETEWGLFTVDRQLKDGIVFPVC